MYAVQSPDRLPLDDTHLLIANSLDLIVFIGRGVTSTGAGVRYVSSIREVTGADGTMVSSNEIFAPGPDRRAVPASPMQTRNLAAPVPAGLAPHLLTSPGGGWA